MDRRTFVRPEAQINIREVAVWYEQREPGLGRRFMREIRQSLHSISKSPLRFPVIEKGVRRLLLHRFPYAVYFLSENDNYDCYRCTSSTPGSYDMEEAVMTSLFFFSLSGVEVFQRNQSFANFNTTAEIQLQELFGDAGHGGQRNDYSAAKLKVIGPQLHPRIEQRH